MALTAGVVLAVMIDWNGLLAFHTTPLFASWIAHGVGAAAGLGLVAFWPSSASATRAEGRWPFWSYLGGIPGAFTVLLAAMTVNGPLGLAGTLALMLVGQTMFGVVADKYGMFGLARRRLAPEDMIAIGLVLAGSIAILASRTR
jgi:transporter family-2 protein